MLSLSIADANPVWRSPKSRNAAEATATPCCGILRADRGRGPDKPPYVVCGASRPRPRSRSRCVPDASNGP
jgi:hypothetical protein